MRQSKGDKESRVLGPETSGKTILAPTSIAQALFNFEGADIRVITGENGESLFVAKDIASILGYAKTRNAISLHCKGALIQGVPTSSGVQQMTIIPERDLYRLIMRSKLPLAEAFEEWVVSEVLPAIRKTGSYRAPPIDFNDPEQMKALVAQCVEKVQAQGVELEQAKPKVMFHDQVVGAEDSLSVAEAGKLIGIGQNRLMAFLRQQGWVTRRNTPYQKKIESGHLDTRLTVYRHPVNGPTQAVSTRVTGKGLAAIHVLYRENIGDAHEMVQA